MRELPSFNEKFKNDHWIHTFSVMTVFLIVFSIFILFVHFEESWPVSLFILFLSIFPLIGLYVRSNMIQALFKKGVVIKATIVKRKLWGRVPYILVEYNYEGKDYKTRISVNYTNKISRYRINESIKILISPSVPENCIVYSVYEDKKRLY